MAENKLFSKLWNELVPQSGEPNYIQGKLVWAIGRLKHEWRNNGNGNWDGVDYYLDMIQRLWDTLVFEEIDPELYYDFDELEIENLNKPPENFDAERNEQIKQDLRFIEMLGLVVKMHLSGDQTEQVLRIVSINQPGQDIDYDAPFDRIEEGVVEWCRANPILREYHSQSSADSDAGSIAHIFE